jgi:hypothetical protein
MNYFDRVIQRMVELMSFIVDVLVASVVIILHSL